MNIHILIIDQNKDFASTLGECLSTYGHDVECVSNVGEALEKLQNNLFDVLFCEADLPRISGLSLLKTVKSRYPHMPVMMMSGLADRNLAKQSLQNGAWDFLYKPFRFKEIDAVLNCIKDRKERFIKNKTLD